MIPMDDTVQVEEMISLEWACPFCGSIEVSQSIDDSWEVSNTEEYPWYCLDCGWKGSTSKLVTKEVAL